MKLKGIWCPVLFLLLFLTACYPTRNVPEGEYLLIKNKYKLRSGKVKNENISGQLAQKTNKKILFYRFYLNMYNLGTRFKDSTWLHRLFAENIGEPPVILDTNQSMASGINIKKHLNNLGYYNSEVYVQTKRWPGLKVASTKFLIDAGKPYTIRKISYHIPEADLRRFVQADLANSKIKTGMNFRVSALEDERERIVQALNNSGYYYFTRSQISFLADTNLLTNQVDLTLKILPQKSRDSREDSVIYLRDRKFVIQSIYVIYDLLRNELGTAGTDTLEYSVSERNNRVYRYYIIHRGELNINPKAIVDALFFKPGRYYKKGDVVESYKSLSTLKTYRYVNIQLEDISKKEDKNGSLNAYVSLLSAKKLSFSSDTEVKNTGGDLGLQQNIGMSIRNTFRNAEILSLDLHGAMEMQATTNVDYTSKWPFNVYEAGLNASINFPRFISPFKMFKGSRYLRPKTRVTLGYNYQKRPDYTRYIINASFGYNWQPRPNHFHNFRLFEVNSVKIYPSTSFQKIIDAYTDPRIVYSFQDHLVLSTNYSFTYNEQRFKGLRPFGFFFGAVDVGGMPWNLIPRIASNNTDTIGQIRLFGLPSAEYVKLELDGRYYIPSGRSIMNVVRAYMGIGLPYGSSKALPFEKSFYIGGANSLRGWTIGTLGPGEYASNATTFEMTGDVKLEINYEFRFALSGGLEGAFFADAGNIWLVNKSESMPGGQFKFNRFIPQMAMDFGYGIRYDLQYLIIRVDIAHPIYQPYFPAGSRWTARSSSGNLLAGFNFAIGYPF